jgi:hypothetical protein
MTSTIAALPFFGGEFSTFDPLDAGTFEITTAGTFDATFARCSMFVDRFSGGFTSPKWADASTFWYRLQAWNSLATALTGEAIVRFSNNAGTVVAELWATPVGGSGVQVAFSVKTLQSGVLTTVGSSVTVGSNLLQTLDIKFVAGGGGSVTFYTSGTFRWTATGLDHSGWAGIGQYLSKSNLTSDEEFYYSQMVGKTTSTIGNFVYTDRLDTESAAPNNAWAGGVTDINEIVYNDSTFISTNVANDISTFYDSTLNLTGYSILGRGVASRTRVQDAGPTGCQLVLESGGTNYFSATITLAVAFEALFNSWTVNPNGSVAWTPTTAAASKGGVKAIA